MKEIQMKYALSLIVAGVLTFGAHIGRPAAQNTEPAAQLSEQQKAAIVTAVLEAKSHQKTPKDFAPAVGASVPKSLFIHGFKPEITARIPELKQYWYAHTDEGIILVDASQTIVAAMIPISQSATTAQGHHGAAEPADKSRTDTGSSNADSVPAYTSPETIK
jgi:hypothetical protein